MTDVMASPCGTPAPAEPPLDPRIAWANSIRKIVTRPDAINEDGSLNQQFFKPKKVVYAAEKAKWNDDDKENIGITVEQFIAEKVEGFIASAHDVATQEVKGLMEMKEEVKENIRKHFAEVEA